MERPCSRGTPGGTCGGCILPAPAPRGSWVENSVSSSIWKCPGVGVYGAGLARVAFRADPGSPPLSGRVHSLPRSAPPPRSLAGNPCSAGRPRPLLSGAWRTWSLPLPSCGFMTSVCPRIFVSPVDGSATRRGRPHLRVLIPQTRLLKLFPQCHYSTLSAFRRGPVALRL